jgi:hypothetical protein
MIINFTLRRSRYLDKGESVNATVTVYGGASSPDHGPRVAVGAPRLSVSSSDLSNQIVVLSVADTSTFVPTPTNKSLYFATHSAVSRHRDLLAGAGRERLGRQHRDQRVCSCFRNYRLSAILNHDSLGIEIDPPLVMIDSHKVADWTVQRCSPSSSLL